MPKSEIKEVTIYSEEILSIHAKNITILIKSNDIGLSVDVYDTNKTYNGEPGLIQEGVIYFENE